MYKAFKLSPFAHSKILNQVCVRAYKYTMLMITNTVILEALYFNLVYKNQFWEDTIFIEVFINTNDVNNVAPGEI